MSAEAPGSDSGFDDAQCLRAALGLDVPGLCGPPLSMAGCAGEEPEGLMACGRCASAQGWSSVAESAAANWATVLEPQRSSLWRGSGGDIGGNGVGSTDAPVLTFDDTRRETAWRVCIATYEGYYTTSLCCTGSPACCGVRSSVTAP